MRPFTFLPHFRLPSHTLVSLVFLLTVTTCCSLRAQTDPTGGAGVKAYGAYHGSKIEQISVETSKAIVNIPLLSYPQRGGKLRADFVLHYHNPVYSYQSTCNKYLHPCIKTFVMDAPPSMWVALEGFPGTSWIALPSPYSQYPDLQIVDSDGGFHQAAPIDSATGKIFRTIDATGYWYNYSAYTLVDPNGVRFISNSTSSQTTAEDPNGNEITVNFGTNAYTNVVDTLNRNIPGPPLNSNGGPTGANPTTDFSGCTGPLPTQSASLWSVPGANGGTVTFKFCFASVHIQINAFPTACFTGYSCSEPNANFTLIQSIVLPNGTAWEFEYNGGTNSSDSTVNAGLLSKITLPTGGQYSYTWNTPPEYQNGPSYNPQVQTRTLNAGNGSSGTWTYAPVWNGTTLTHDITDPLGNTEVHTLSNLAGSCGSGTYEVQVQYYQGAVSSANLLKTVSTAYSHTSNPYPGALRPGACGITNVVPTSTTTAWPNGQTSQTSKSYDAGFSYYPPGGSGTNPAIYGKVVSEASTDYGQNAAGPTLKTVNNTWLALVNSNYLNGNLLNLLSSEQILDGSGTQRAYTSYTYDSTSILSSGVSTRLTSPPNGAYRGNPTVIGHWLNTNGSYLNTTNTYYDTGMLGMTTDPLDHATQYSYSTTYAGGYLTSVQDALNHTTTLIYDYNTGEMLSKTDPNQLSINYSYDAMNRLVKVVRPDGGQTTYTFAETAVPFSVTTTTAINPSLNETGVEYVDGFGKKTRSALTSDPQGTVYVDTTYDILGRASSISNPYRTGSDVTTSNGTTNYSYDALSRKTSETYPDGSVLATAYCGSSTLVTDPTTRWRRSRTDGLGRLVEVDEPNAVGASVNSNGCPGSGEPIWVTSYGYDALGNLISAVQNGSRSRTFTFDSLSRMLTSSNPEVGTITYAYNPDNTLYTKTDGRNITTTYAYDALRREKSASYSNGDPTISTNYDEANCLGLTACQNIGQRTSMTDAAGSESWSYQVDATNHRSIHVNQRTTSGITKTTTYILDYAGNTTQATYPTGRVVNYTFDSANRPSTAIDGSSGITYATGFQTSPGGTCLNNVTCYTPQGTFYGLSIGQTSSFTGLNLTHIYNSRLQPQEFKASSTGGNAIDVSYGFADPNNNNKNAGHVFSITNNLDSTRSQRFSYDQLNRLTSAWTTSTYSTSPAHCWGESFTLDSWGNLNSIAAISNSNYTGCFLESGFSSTADTNNHLPAWGYDASGNATSDGFITNYQWDAESQLKSAAGVTYTYDGDGRRVSKSNGKLYWYDGGNEILAETDASGNTTAEYIFFGGKRIAQSNLGSIDVRFTNDSCSACGGNPVGGGDRNLFINSVTVGSTTVYPNDPSVSYVTPPCNEYANGVGQIDCNGDMIVNKPLGAPGQTITVNAYGSTDYNIYPHMQLYLNGVLIGQWDVTGSSQNYTATIANAAVVYYVEDLLGTSRVLTTSTGVVCYDADFYPYGGERAYTNSCPQNYKFEGKERDTETGNDDFGARYYSNRFGRWLSADWSAVPAPIPYANLTNPQTLNLYAMVSDDPESFADLDGHNQYSAANSPCSYENQNQCNTSQQPDNKTAEDAQTNQSAAQQQAQQKLAQNTYKSKDAAAAAAVEDMRNRENGYGWEYGARIHKDGDTYSYGPVVTDKDPKGVNLPDLQKNDVGDVHTHNYRVGDDAHANSIEQPDRISSVQDKAAVQKMNPGGKVNYDSYVGAPNGNLIRFTPNPKAPDNLGNAKVVRRGVAPDPNPPQ